MNFKPIDVYVRSKCVYPVFERHVNNMYEMTEKSVSYLANNCGKNNKKKILEEKKKSEKKALKCLLYARRERIWSSEYFKIDKEYTNALNECEVPTLNSSTTEQ